MTPSGEKNGRRNVNIDSSARSHRQFLPLASNSPGLNRFQMVGPDVGGRMSRSRGSMPLVLRCNRLMRAGTAGFGMVVAGFVLAEPAQPLNTIAPLVQSASDAGARHLENAAIEFDQGMAQFNKQKNDRNHGWRGTRSRRGKHEYGAGPIRREVRRDTASLVPGKDREAPKLHGRSR
jgi:hypothetical protein